MATDVLLVSLGATAGLRRADAELLASIGRAGVSAELVGATRPRPRIPTMALGDYAFASNAREAAERGIDEHQPRAVIYSTTTAAALWPRPGAIRFDAPSAGNRPGRHGVWQRRSEKRRLREAALLLPWSEGGLAEAPEPHADAVVLGVPVEPSGPIDGERDVAAVTYAAHAEKKGLDDVLAAWAAAARAGEELVVVGAAERTAGDEEGGVRAGSVRFEPLLAPDEYRALLRRARLFVTAPRREDYGIAQLEALADGCALVTTAAPGPYAALPLARELDPRLVTEDLAAAIRTALDDPAAGYAARAAELLAPWRRDTLDALVAERVLPRLLP
jgi:glycosyltransferase involved in cell wall biosynthesis